MIYELKIMNGDIFEIKEETANKISNAKGLVLIKEIGTMVNMSSVVSISPKGLAKNKESKNTIKCHDGSIAIKKFGKWYDQYSGSEMNLSVYPELLEKKESKQLEEPSKYAKELLN